MSEVELTIDNCWNDDASMRKGILHNIFRNICWIISWIFDIYGD